MSPRGSLAGRVVIVTRPRDQSIDLVRKLKRRGASLLVAPAIELTPARSAALTRALKDVSTGKFDWITLTSRATVDVLRSRLKPRDVRARAAAVGEGTAEAFRRWARRDSDLVPRTVRTAPRNPRTVEALVNVIASTLPAARASRASFGSEDAMRVR